MAQLLLKCLLFLALSQVDGQNDRELLQRRDPRVYSNYEIVDSEGKYEVEWVVNWEQRRIVFEVTVQTRGYVAFGLSTEQGFEGADIVIGGVARNGSYFTDRYGINDRVEPRIDISQDWQLHEAKETGSQTYLRFSRAFDTCDDEDLLINEFDTVYIAWSYGQSDNPSQEWNQNRNVGFYPVNLLDPNVIPKPMKQATYQTGPPPNSVMERENFQVWTVNTRTRLPPTETAYMCSMHQAPRLRRKNHVIGFHVRLETMEAFQHTHHLLLYRCVPPANSTAFDFFTRYLSAPAEICYFLSRPTGQIPTQYCTRVTSGYGIGARITMLPDHAGIPIGLDQDEFYVLQVHYDNPESRSDLEFDIDIDLFYTPDLRQNDVGIMTVGHHIPGSPSILIPPSTPAHNIYGHCSPECTQTMLPADGINVFMANLHTHYAGRKARIRHFRGNQELPWMLDDSNYDPAFQNFRLFKQEINIARGDQLTMECEFDSTEANGTIVGGFATRQEMCLSYLLYYNILEEYSLCRSEISDQFYMRKYLGVNNITWSQEKLDMVATSPRNVAGLSMAEISDTRVRWTPLLRNELQYDHRTLPQVNACSRSPFSSGGQGQVEGGDETTSTVSLPNNVREYTPPARTCPQEQRSIQNRENQIDQVGRGEVRRLNRNHGRRRWSGKKGLWNARNL